jgi:hypothetical protein
VHTMISIIDLEIDRDPRQRQRVTQRQTLS